MKQTISKNDKSITILNKLILNGFYKGSINNESFELISNNFPNNYRLIGLLNKEQKFVLKLDYKQPVKIAVKITLILSILFSTVLLVKGKWFLVIPFFILPILFSYINFRLKGKKEIEYFVSRYLELYKSEYE